MRGLVRGTAVPCSFRFVTGEESCGLLSGSGAEIGPNCVISALLPPWDRELQYSTVVARRHTVNTVPSVLRDPVVRMRVLALKPFTSSTRADEPCRRTGVWV